jgi:hypothetical protein
MPLMRSVVPWASVRAVLLVRQVSAMCLKVWIAPAGPYVPEESWILRKLPPRPGAWFASTAWSGTGMS